MKHLKSYEDKKKESKLKTVKFSEIGDSWRPEDIIGKEEREAKFTGKKNFDLNKGQKVKDMLLKYRIGIISVGPGDWLHRQQIVLKPEEVFKEYRVELGIVPTFETFIENNDMFIEDYENMSEEEQLEWTEKYENEAKPEESGYRTFEFSVFFPLNLSQDKELCALCDATNYLKLLNEVVPNDVKNGNIEDDCLRNETKGFKKFLNVKEIDISNDNIEDIPNINYRIYKDTKFLGYLKDVCEENSINYNKLINDWLKLT